MALQALIPLLLAGGAGFLGGRANKQRTDAEQAYKEGEQSRKALLHVAENLAQGNNGQSDLAALQALAPQFSQVPQGDQMLQAFTLQAQSNILGREAMSARSRQIMGQLFGFGGGGEAVETGASPGMAPASMAPGAQPPAQIASQVPQQVPTPAQALSLSMQNRPERFEGQVGALPQPDLAGTPSPGPPPDRFTGVSDFRPTNALPSGARQVGIDMEHAVPADMSTAIQRLDATEHQEEAEPNPELEAGLVSEGGRRSSTPTQRTAATQVSNQQAPIRLPGFLRSGIGNFTIPKEMSGLGISMSGTADELKQHYIGLMRQRGASDIEIMNEFQAQGIPAPANLQKDGFNEFSNKLLLNPQTLRTPRLALQQIAERFPNASPEAFRSFGHDLFTGAYVGARERLRATGQFLTAGQLSQAAFAEAVSSVGGEFAPQNILTDVDRSRATSMDAIMSDLFDQLPTNPRALDAIKSVIQFQAGKVSGEEAARTIARINAEQSTQFMSPEQLSKIERGGKPLPFGTTPAQAAGRGSAPAAAIITPEQQSTRTQRATQTDQMKFASERSIPIFEAARDRILDLTSIAQASGPLGKAAGLAGIPTELGQAISRYDAFKETFAGNLRALSGETSGVLTKDDVTRIVGIFPPGKDFVNLTTDRTNQLIRSFSEIQQIMSDRLGQKFTLFQPIIEKLKKLPADTADRSKGLADFQKAMESLGQ